MPRITKPTITATPRWIHSIHALAVVERRQDLAVAQRPVGAAEPGVGGAHDDADRDQQRASSATVAAARLWKRVTRSSWSIAPGPMDPARAARRRRRRSRARHGRATRLPFGACHVPRLDRRRRWRSPWSSPPAAARRRPRPRRRPSGSASAGARLRERARASTGHARRLGCPGDHAHGPSPISSSRCGHLRARHGSCCCSSTAQNRVVSAPDRTASIAFYDLARTPRSRSSTADGTFIWAIEDETRHLRRRRRRSPRPATWGAEFTTAARRQADRDDAHDASTSSRQARRTVRSATKAPASKTPTLADVGGDLTKISTDAKPEPRASTRRPRPTRSPQQKPFVLVFATPKFCTSAQCGPTLDQLKPIAAAIPGRDVHQRRAVRAQARRRRSSSRSSTPADPAGPDADRRHERVGPAQRAVDLRVDGNGVVQRVLRADRSPAEMDAAIKAIVAGRLSAPPAAVGHVGARGGASSSRIACSVPLVVAVPDADRLAGAWCSLRWPGGNSTAFSRVRERRTAIAHRHWCGA